MGWFGPRTGDCTCCNDCPTCTLYQDGCVIRWSCDPSDTATFTLTYLGVDHDVANEGYVVAIPGEGYTLAVEDTDCSRFYNVLAEDDCSCPSGCETFDQNAGLVVNARDEAVLTVSDFSSGQWYNSTYIPTLLSFCEQWVDIDLSSLNHTYTAPIVVREYTHEGETCYYTCIPGPISDYYVGSFTIYHHWFDGFNHKYAESDWDVYMAFDSLTGPDGLQFVHTSYMYMTRTASRPFAGGPGLGTVCPTLPGYTFMDCASFPCAGIGYNFGYEIAAGQTGAGTQFGHGKHPRWCEVDSLGTGVEWIMKTLFPQIIGAPGNPAGWNGKTVWEGLF